MNLWYNRGHKNISFNALYNFDLVQTYRGLVHHQTKLPVCQKSLLSKDDSLCRARKMSLDKLCIAGTYTCAPGVYVQDICKQDRPKNTKNIAKKLYGSI